MREGREKDKGERRDRRMEGWEGWLRKKGGYRRREREEGLHILCI